MAHESPAVVLYDANGNPVKITLDGSDYKLEAITKVKNSSGTVINPAKEDGNLSTLASVDFATQTTLSAIKGKTDNLPSDPAREGGNLSTLAGKDFATQTTLSSIKGKTDNIPSDPAREGGNLATIAGKDFSTETTLSSIKSKTDNIPSDPAKESGKLTTIDSTLTSIKSTDGIKKIVDSLPAGDNNIGNFDLASSIPAGTNNIGDVDLASPIPSGTNEIGKIAQGTRAEANAGWPLYIVDDSGNKVGIILDGSIYRLQTDSKIAKGSSSLVHLDTIDTTSGRGRLKATLYTSDGDPVSFGSVPPNPESIRNAFVVNGSNDSMLVDGSSTPVVFSYSADSTHDISIQELKFVMAANGITFGTDKFGVTTKLTNGLLIELISDGNTGTVANLTTNECFAHLSSPGGFTWVVSSKDMMSVSYSLGGSLRLKAGTSDKVKITIRDNLSAAATYFKCCVKGNLLESV